MLITDMRGVDLSKYSFDYDLTLAALTLHPDGHVYHAYGGRDQRSASHWTTEESFAALLGESLEEHGSYLESPEPPELAAPLRPERIPAFAKRDKGACIHCHNVHEGLQQELKDQGTWKVDDIWVHPEPGLLGLDLGRDDQREIVAVRQGSSAAAAGLLVGDRLLRAGERAILTATDLMQVAHGLPMEACELSLSFLRGGQPRVATLELAAGWKRGTPESFAWRALKWTLDPVPGFGGPALEPAEREALDLAEGDLAFRIQYFVTWGPRAAYGRAAGRAGLREGDVVFEVGGKRDFTSVEHFHAWWRLTREVGEEVLIRLLRDGERLEVKLRVRG